MLRSTGIFAAAFAALILAAPPASAEMTKCRLTYDLEGWSVIYKYSSGTGRISCSNGQTADVKIVTHGGGVSFGTQRVIAGSGSFSSVHDISDLYGGYAEVVAHAGAGGSADARAMMRRSVNLSLAGTGQGINLGFAFGSFSIRPR